MSNFDTGFPAEEPTDGAVVESQMNRLGLPLRAFFPLISALGVGTDTVRGTRILPCWHEYACEFEQTLVSNPEPPSFDAFPPKPKPSTAKTVSRSLLPGRILHKQKRSACYVMPMTSGTFTPSLCIVRYYLPRVQATRTDGIRNIHPPFTLLLASVPHIRVPGFCVFTTL